ncbi:hypothetical protein NQZ68_008762 [Dissostichus eleginoides]|nr:hypothetical protein NQZ68_008762 [Dissostichus eleginoides]
MDSARTAAQRTVVRELFSLQRNVAAAPISQLGWRTDRCFEQKLSGQRCGILLNNHDAQNTKVVTSTSDWRSGISSQI